MEIQVAEYTDIGSRKVNEDSLLCLQSRDRSLFVVADGLGGHGMGDVASQLVCETAKQWFHRLTAFHPDMFDAVYRSCQENLTAQQRALHSAQKMRTTMSMLCTDGRMVYWSHIGDSRIYYFQDKQLIRRTFDHSVPQMLAAAGQLKESEIRFHEDRNRLLRVLGVAGQAPAYEAEKPLALTGEQQFLLCSDGFWELISEEQMLLCLDEADEPQLWLDNMVELANRNGRCKSRDNMTAIAVWIK